MKIHISVEREYDTESDDHAHLFEGLSGDAAIIQAKRYFIDDLDEVEFSQLEVRILA